MHTIKFEILARVKLALLPKNIVLAIIHNFSIFQKQYSKTHYYQAGYIVSDVKF